MLVSIVSLRDILAVSCQWRSWDWQKLYLREDVPLTPRLRLVQDADNKELRIMVLLAKYAFFEFGKTDICMLCEREGYALDTGQTLFDTLYQAILRILQYNDDQIMTILRLRFAQMPGVKGDLAGLLHTDEASACLDRHDIAKLKKVIDDVQDREEGKTVFLARFKEKRAELHAASKEGSHGEKGQGGRRLQWPRKVCSAGRRGDFSKYTQALLTRRSFNLGC